jgi:Gas vesicle synthesis protein GvpL/GvpF
MSQTQTARTGSMATRVSCQCRSARPGDPAVSTVVWVYAVTVDLDPDQLSRLTGVGGEPVRVVTEAGLSAVVGSVDATIFGEQSLTGLLADPANIETIGRAHHDVVTCAASNGAVVPLRLATIYPDDVTIHALLAERHTELSFLLQSFQGTEEWGVKVHMELGADSAHGATRAGSFDDRGGLPVREPRWQLAEACAEKINRALSGIAIATRRHPAPYPQFDDVEGWTVLNGVYLLDTERAAEFGGIVQRLTAEHAGLRAEVTGPWPPYSFVDRQEV